MTHVVTGDFQTCTEAAHQASVHHTEAAEVDFLRQPKLRRRLLDVAVQQVVTIEAVFAEPEGKEKKTIASPLKDLPNGGNGVEWAPFWEPQGVKPNQNSRYVISHRSWPF